MIASKHFLATTVFAASCVSYIRPAYAGSCSIIASGDFVCSGSSDISDATQALSGTPLNVTTTSDFEIATQTGNGLDLTGSEGISFTQTGDGSITGADVGLKANNDGLGGQSITFPGQMQAYPPFLFFIVIPITHITHMTQLISALHQQEVFPHPKVTEYMLGRHQQLTQGSRLT